MGRRYDWIKAHETGESRSIDDVVDIKVRLKTVRLEEGGMIKLIPMRCIRGHETTWNIYPAEGIIECAQCGEQHLTPFKSKGDDGYVIIDMKEER